MSRCALDGAGSPMAERADRRIGAPDDPAAAKIERAFERVLWLLRDYLPDLVVVGGWVPQLYGRYSGDPWHGRSSLTIEVDAVAVPPIPTRGRPTLDEILRASGLVPNREHGPSAVWTAAHLTGERIEFLTPHTGTARQQGATITLQEHGDVGAISLPAIGFLATHTATLSVPVGEFDGRQQAVTVTVPLLGAYLLNKASTFPARRPHADGPNPKQAKDLVYIHDVMAAGDVVRKRIDTDMRLIWAASTVKGPDRQVIRSAQHNVELVLHGPLGQTLLPASAAQLSMRDGVAIADAGAAIRGYLTDYAEMLHDVCRRRRP